ncbi:UNVERIFIED_CONTAM: hypothetical protein GTU68_022758 [Idotea baltica]|nr:hypothetical protein [Idotea baltica]
MSSFFISALLAAPFALLLDRLLGEPKRLHPLIGFGNFAIWLESKLNQSQFPLLWGVLAWLLAVTPFVLIIAFTQQYMSPFVAFLLNVVFGYLAIGWNSLEEHGLAVANAFKDNNLKRARLRTSYLVSRDTSELDETSLSRATIESVLENGSDAVFSAVFYLCLFGAPGVVLYRLSNTLDAMWGYRNERFEYFGKFTARVDDVLNYIPARLCALLYALSGDTKKAIAAWKTQASNWYSPNAGIVMATGAGALDLRLGGSAIYHGKIKSRPNLGHGKEAQADDIQRSLTLLNHSIYLLIFALLIISVITISFLEINFAALI